MPDTAPGTELTDFAAFGALAEQVLSQLSRTHPDLDLVLFRDAGDTAEIIAATAAAPRPSWMRHAVSAGRGAREGEGWQPLILPDGHTARWIRALGGPAVSGFALALQVPPSTGLDAAGERLAPALAALDAGALLLTRAEGRARDLARAGERAAILEASLPDLLLRMDPRGTVTFMNAPLQRALGLSGPTSIETVIGTLEADRLRDALSRRGPGSPQFATDGLMTLRDGTERLIRWTHRMIFDDHALREVVSVGRDMSEEQDRMSEMVRRALSAEFQNREKTIILENISHEIRTPLNAIVGMAEILLREPLSDTQQNMVQTIQSAGRQVAGLLDGMRDFDRLGRGTAHLSYSTFRTTDVIDAVVAQVRGALDPATQTLEVQLDLSAQAPIRGDRTRVQQVVTNLVVNAIRHAGPACITICAELSQMPGAEPGLLSVTVSDNGRGISSDMQDVIFERFSRGHAMAETGAPGMGLGLSISSSICLLHGGDLLLQPSEGGGATFIATFQVEDGAQDALDIVEGHGTAVPRLEGTMPGLHLLVAEDNQMNQEVLAAMLAEDPVRLTFVDNGLQAVEALRGAHFDGALIDLRMPLMDGREFATVFHELREAGLVADMPLVACSADPMVGRLESVRNAGFQRALTKPITRMDLSACLDWIRERGEIGARSRPI